MDLLTLPLHFDDDLLPVERGAVHLPEGGCGEGRRVEGVEELVDGLGRHLEPQQRHRLAELGARDRAVAVLVPLAEEVDHADRLRLQRVVATPGASYRQTYMSILVMSAF